MTDSVFVVVAVGIVGVWALLVCVSFVVGLLRYELESIRIENRK